jgi:IS30 family transposase
VEKIIELKGGLFSVGYYFARAYHSGERGANENLRGLIWQYFPESICFKNVIKQQVRVVKANLIIDQERDLVLKCKTKYIYIN